MLKYSISNLNEIFRILQFCRTYLIYNGPCVDPIVSAYGIACPLSKGVRMLTGASNRLNRKRLLQRGQCGEGDLPAGSTNPPLTLL